MIEIAAAIALIALNGLFAISELAVVSSRPERLRALLRTGRRGAAAALHLAENPGRFLSTVQIGITLVGLIAGAFSGAALSHRLASLFEALGADPILAEGLGFGLIIAALTYLSVILGELVPKHLALRDPERIACALAPLMWRLSRIAAPIVWFLDASTRVFFRLFGWGTRPKRAITDEEIKSVLAEAESAGTIENVERQMMAGVMRLADRSVRGVMTPRTEVEALDVSDDDATVRRALATAHHSILPVVDGDPDNVVGIVQLRELLAASISGAQLNIRGFVRKAPVVPDTLDALDVVEALRSAEIPVALVHDEYGHFEGIVTPTDTLKAIVGAFKASAGEEEPNAVQREDGSWLIAGAMPADEMAELLGIALPERRAYETVAGLLIDALQRLPSTGESVEALGYRFEVLDMDGRRIDKVLATRATG